MLPLSLLKAAENSHILIEVKNGDTYNGRLVSCNMFMNVCLQDVICTSREGDRFWKIPECYIRGYSIKYMRIPDEVIDTVSEENQTKKFQPARGGRGGGRIGGRFGNSGGRGGRSEEGGRGGRGGGAGRGNGGRDGGRGGHNGRGYTPRGGRGGGRS